MSDVFSRWHLISCQVRCGVIRSVTKDDKDDRDEMAISYLCSLCSPAWKSEGGLFVHFPNDLFRLFSHVAGREFGGS